MMGKLKKYLFNWAATATLAIVLSGRLISSCAPSGGDRQDTGALTFLLAFLYFDNLNSPGMKVEGTAYSVNMIQFRNESGKIAKTVTPNALGEFSVTLSTGTYHVRTFDEYGNIQDDSIIVKSYGVIEPDDPDSFNNSIDYKKMAFLLSTVTEATDDETDLITVNTYDDDGNLLERKTYSGSSETEENLYSTLTVTYNEKGKLEMRITDYEGSDDADSLSVISFDEKDRTKAMLFYYGGTTTDTAALYTTTVYAWDDDGKLLEKSYTDWTDSDNSNYTTYSYNEKDLISEIKEYEEGSDATTATLSNTITMTYSDDGYLLTYTGVPESELSSNSVTTFQYDTDNNMTLFSSYTGDTDVDSATLVTTKTYTYEIMAIR